MLRNGRPFSRYQKHLIMHLLPWSSPKPQRPDVSRSVSTRCEKRAQKRQHHPRMSRRISLLSYEDSRPQLRCKIKGKLKMNQSEKRFSHELTRITRIISKIFVLL